MHARNNTEDGVLCHTISTVKWHNLWFNDNLVGEVGVNAALCGSHGVPILLVTGDEAVCRESKTLLGTGLTEMGFSPPQAAPFQGWRLGDFVVHSTCRTEAE